MLDRIPTPAGHLAVLNSAKFVVLDPRVGLDDFGGGQESEDRCVALGEAAIVPQNLRALGSQCVATAAIRWAARRCRAGRRGSLNTLESTRHDLGTSPLWFCVALDRQLELGDECVIGCLYSGGIW